MTDTEEVKLERMILEKLDSFEASSKGKKKDWFSPPMIMAYVSILGLLGVTGENISSRLAGVQKSELGQKTQGELTEVFVESIDSLATRMDEQEVYLEAVVDSLSRYQRNKFERLLDGVEKPALQPAPRIDPEESTSADEVMYLVPPDELLPNVEDGGGLEETPVDSILQQLQVQVKAGKSLDFDKVKAAVQNKRGRRE